MLFHLLKSNFLARAFAFASHQVSVTSAMQKFAVDKLHRSLRLAHFFNENDTFPESSDDEGFSHRNFRPRSTWTPPGNPPPSLASFMTANNTALTNLPVLK